MSKKHNLSQEGLAFIAAWEGFSHSLYNDAAGHCTIGFGHLVHRGSCNGNEPIEYLMGITQQQGLEILHHDGQLAVQVVHRLVKQPINQHQFDALVSFTFNLGATNLNRSTLLKKVNAGRFNEVPREFKRWVYAGGRVLKGLQKRRAAEAQMFSCGNYTGQP